MKKHSGDNVRVSSARVDFETNKVKKAHTSMVDEKSSLENNFYSGGSIARVPIELLGVTTTKCQFAFPDLR